MLKMGEILFDLLTLKILFKKYLRFYVSLKCKNVKIKITVYRKHLVFSDSSLTHSFVSVKVCKTLVNFKCNESTRNLKYVSFFKKDRLEIMQKFYSHINLNLTSKKNYP